VAGPASTRSVTLRVDLAAALVALVPPAGADGLAFSLYGSGEFTPLISGYQRSATGLDGKQRVTFDLALRNGVAGRQFVTTSRSPAPPDGYSGLMVFPYRVSISGSGAVTPSVDWDNPAFKFLGTTPCSKAGTTPGCARWEPYPGPLRSGTTSSARRVGFNVDPTVRAFDVQLVLAAELVAEGTGTVQGPVESPERGPLARVVVSASGRSSETDERGEYQISKVGGGPAVVARSQPDELEHKYGSPRTLGGTRGEHGSAPERHR
jgi:hypothetical protein